MSRQAWLELSINSTSISDDVGGDTLSFSYTDNAADSVDDISLTVENIDMRWLNEWFPMVGATMEATIVTTEGSLDCGKFIIDDVDFSGGGGTTMNIKAIAVEIGNDFNDTKRNRTWENASIGDIASSLCEKANMPLEYEAAYNPTLPFTAQSNQSDRDFLYSLCQKYGLAMKMYSSRIFIYDKSELEAVQGSKLDVTDMVSWSARMTVNDAGYSSVTVKYLNLDGQLIEYKYEVQGKTPKGYAHNVKVSSLAEAQRVAKAKLRELNAGEVTLSCTVVGDTNMVAGRTLEVTGTGQFDGVYFADRAAHSVGGGYTTALEMHRVEKYTVLTPDTPEQLLKVGSVVRITGTHYATGEKIPDWVKERTHTVMEVKPEKVLLKEVYSWVNVSDIVVEG